MASRFFASCCHAGDARLGQNLSPRLIAAVVVWPPTSEPHARRHALGAGRGDLAYVAGQRPTFYAFNQPGMARSFFQSDFFVAQRPEYFQVEFPEGTFKSLHLAPALFVRKDRPALAEVERALGARLIDARP